MTAKRALAMVVVAISLLAAGCKEDKKLKVTSISPDKGDYEGGQLVVVKGNRFTADGVRSVKVYFGGVPAQVLRFEGDDTLKVLAPGGKVGDTVDVKFYFEPGGVLNVPKAFTFMEEHNSTVEDVNTNKSGSGK
jgi:IPT/TIG domain-containing protein